MDILLTNHHLKQLGGSETFTYAMAKELQNHGHNVEVYTFIEGIVSKHIEQVLNIKVHTGPETFARKYDRIFANHYACVDVVAPYGPVVQTVHGVVGYFEKPNQKADAFVAISEEVRHLLSSQSLESYLIYNGVDCERFAPVKPIKSSIEKVFSLSQSDELNEQMKKFYNSKGIGFICANKNNSKESLWHVEQLMNESDLVVSLGRGAYEALACGRNVLVVDQRKYMGGILGDGMVTRYNIEKFLSKNCSGRFNRFSNLQRLLSNSLEQYDPDFGEYARNFALEKLNIKKQVGAYLGGIV